MTRGNVRRPAEAAEDGFAMAALLVALSVMAILMTVALPHWHTLARREKEAELVFRGEQYARAIALFQRQYGGAFPPNVDILVTERFLRKKYLDPITGEDFEIITPGSAIEGIDPSELGGQPGRQGGAGEAARGTGRGFRVTLSGDQGTAAGRGGGTGGRGSAAGARGAGAGARGRATQALRLSLRGATAAATGGVQGVRSSSADESLRVYNGAERYDQWLFIATQATLAAGAGAVGADAPGVDEGGRGRAGGGRGGRGEATGGGRGRGGRGDATGGRGRGGRGDATGGRGGRGRGF